MKALQNIFLSLVLVNMVSFASASTSEKDANKTKKPNILLIIGDDMAFTDIQPYGSEINTPTLDMIANHGVSFSNFHATPVCSVSRSELITGNNNIEIGLASFDYTVYPPTKGKPGYEAYLTKNTATISEILQANGYNTYMSGKWHLGGDAIGGWGPHEWGFDRSFGILNGGSNHWNDRDMLPNFHDKKVQEIFAKGKLPPAPKAPWRLNGKEYDRPTGIYSNDLYTKKMLDFLREGEKSGKPFFAWMAFTTAHIPIQAPRALVEKYYKVYRKLGYEALKKSRYESMKKMGLITKNAKQAPKNPITTPWNSLSEKEKDRQARIMATYAAMIEDQDYHIGRLIDYLESTNQLDNTLIIYLTDNGPEGFDAASKFTGNKSVEKWIRGTFDQSFNAIGTVNSENYIGLSWANALTGDFQWWKWFINEGGIRTPMMILPPKSLHEKYSRAGEISNVVINIKDIPMTILEYANIKHPSVNGNNTFKGRTITPPSGISFKPFIDKKVEHARTEKQPWAFELFGNAYVMQGNYKAIKVRTGMWGDGKWHLYNVVTDPSESKPLNKKYPKKLAQMIAFYKDYEKKHNILPVAEDWSPFKALSGHK